MANIEKTVQSLNQVAQTPDVLRLRDSFLKRRSEATKKAYETDLVYFSAFLGVSSITNALKTLLSQSSGSANALILDYKNDLIETGKSPATVNRRLATLRSVIKLTRTMGLVNWKIEIESERVENYRDTRGPTRADFEKIWAAVNPNTRKGKRDRAILALLYDRALRRGEIVALDREDLDLSACSIWVKGKGRGGQQPGVHRQGYTGNPAGLIGGQEHRRPGHIPGGAFNAQGTGPTP